MQQKCKFFSTRPTYRQKNKNNRRGQKKRSRVPAELAAYSCPATLPRLQRQSKRDPLSPLHSRSRLLLRRAYVTTKRARAAVVVRVSLARLLARSRSPSRFFFTYRVPPRTRTRSLSFSFSFCLARSRYYPRGFFRFIYTYMSLLICVCVCVCVCVYIEARACPSSRRSATKISFMRPSLSG